MSVATLGLVFATLGATVANWKLLLMPAILAGLYIAAPDLVAAVRPQDSPFAVALVVAELATTIGILARRSLSPQ